MKRIIVAAFVVGLVGCSSDNTTGGASGAGGSGGAGGASGSGGSGAGNPMDAASADTGGGDIPSGTCTEPGSVCATFKLPAFTDMPTRLIAGFYLAPLPPTSPPDKIVGPYDMPKVTAGAQLQMKMTDISVDGDYSLYAALYMPGGGQFQPKPGIDYEAFTMQKVTLSKTAPTTLPGTLEFTLAK